MNNPYPKPLTLSLIREVMDKCDRRAKGPVIYTNDPRLLEQVNKAFEDYINTKYK